KWICLHQPTRLTRPTSPTRLLDQRRLRRPETAIHKLLDALSFVSFTNVEIALRVAGHHVRAVELARLMPGVTERAQHLQRLPVEDPDLLIGAVVDDQMLLRR